jgi:hypothetical protein
MLDRRRFLGTLMASIVGAVVAPKALLWSPSPELGLPPVAPQALLTLDAIVREAARLLAERIELPVIRADEGLRMGDGSMRQQLGIDLALPVSLSETGLDAERYLMPAVACFVGRIERERWRAFGELSVPMVGRASRMTSTRGVTGDGVSVRGVALYDDQTDLTYLRLDVIGG